MKRKKAALYNPYLDILGGGERHILSIMKVLEDSGYEITIFWDQNLYPEIQKKLNITFKDPPLFITNIFSSQTSLIKKLSLLKQFDLFLYVTNGSYFFSSAKKNFIFCMVPERKLYKMGVINRIKTYSNDFIVNSSFTQSWLKKFGIQSQVIYPYINDELINLEIHKKKPIILNVGRFFKQIHTKRQDIAIRVFKELRLSNPNLKYYQLILAGGLKKEDEEYFQELEQLIGNDQHIILKPNINYNELIQLYRESEFYWHFAGYGVDEEKHPEAVEHLGITPLEAMASGCITFCYNAGGPKEIITQGTNGFLFQTNEELSKYMDEVLSSKEKQKEIQTNAKSYIKEQFSYAIFSQRVRKVLLA